MKTYKLLLALWALSVSSAGWAQSTGHIGHGGSASGDACIRAKISRFKPEHLATVAPGSEFSFAASGSNGPGHIHVSIKQQPIQVNIEDKETFYLVKGKLPETLKHTTVRISVNLKAKVGKCDAEDGWLVKISE